MTEPRNISNSEVTTYLSCKRQYNFAFLQELEPKELSVPLTRGTVGHLCFQRYAEARLNGSNHDAAMKAGLGALKEAMADGVPVDIVMEVQILWTRYMEFHNGWPEFEILGTEQKVTVPLTPTLNAVLRYDLYVKHIPTDKRLVLDYKFTYDFWSPFDHDLNGQMPKYIALMQKSGMVVDGGILEEIRTRRLSDKTASDSKNLWRRTFYYPSLARRQNMLRQHVAGALEIERYRGLSEDQRAIESQPVLNKHGICKHCNFKSLCVSMIEGKDDLAVDIRTMYKRNTYSYNEAEEHLG